MDCFKDKLERVTTPSLYGSKTIEHFCKNEKIFIAGYIGDKKDLRIVSHVVNLNENQKFILVPHEISEESLNEIISNIERRSLLFSECTPETDFDNIQVLIIDFLGAAPMIYHYCHYVYIGVGAISNASSIVEAATSGLPIAFRSKVYKKSIHAGTIRRKIGSIVQSGKELDAWLKSLNNNEDA